MLKIIRLQDMLICYNYTGGLTCIVIHTTCVKDTAAQADWQPVFKFCKNVLPAISKQPSTWDTDSRRLLHQIWLRVSGDA